jgi:DNA (cytosine-5)-methyltransferase 1
VSTRPKALDLFCKAGGATRGLQLAGYHVTGVDIAPQPHYCGDAFIQADALTVDLTGYDLIWAGPPCQFASVLTAQHRHKHPNLIPATRARLHATGVPWIIENVAGARRHLHTPLMLCGTMFGLRVWRHRFFESPWLAGRLTPPCRHVGLPVVVSGSPRRRNPDGTPNRTEPSTAERQAAMECPWMTRTELAEASPPAYSEYLGRVIRPYVDAWRARSAA